MEAVNETPHCVAAFLLAVLLLWTKEPQRKMLLSFRCKNFHFRQTLNTNTHPPHHKSTYMRTH